MILENDVALVEISNNGAEIHHFIYKPTQKEWIWNGDPSFWDQHNPILFPIIGSTYDHKIHLKGKEYVLGNHGFARRAYFKTIDHTKSSVELCLEANADTLSQYPYEFKLSVRYDLEKASLKIHYSIENCSQKAMPFSFGLHPAFMMSTNGVNGVQTVFFPNKEKNLPQSILNNDNSLAFDDAFFEKTPTLLLENVASPFVILKDKNNWMRVSVMGYRWLAFWKKPKAAFLCIEPWLGHSDFEKVDCDFSQREGTLILEARRTFVITHKLEASLKGE